MFASPDARAAILDDTTDENLDILAVIAPETLDPEMRATVANVAWGTKRDCRMGRLAFKPYLESVAALEYPEHWSPCANRTEPARQVAASLYRSERLFSELVKHVKGVPGPVDRAFVFLEPPVLDQNRGPIGEISPRIFEKAFG